MKAIFIDKKGNKEDTQVKRNEIAKVFSLNIRDLRPVFSSLQVATVLPRTGSLVINFGFIKAVISKNKVCFLEHQNQKKIDSFIEKLSSSLKNKEPENEISFYLFVFEKILVEKVYQMREKVLKIKNNADVVLKKIKENSSEKGLENLLFLKKKVSRMDIRLNEILSASREVLDDDENFTEFISLENNLKLDGLEAESILENFLEQIEEEISHISRLKEEIEDTQEFVDLKLSSSRTDMARFDLIATLLTLIFSFLAVVVGLFGTNIKNGFESSNSFFILLSISLFLFFLFSSVFFWLYLKKKKVL